MRMMTIMCGMHQLLYWILTQVCRFFDCVGTLTTHNILPMLEILPIIFVHMYNVQKSFFYCTISKSVALKAYLASASAQ